MVDTKKIYKKEGEIFAEAAKKLKKNQGLIKEFNCLQKITKRPCEYHIKEALIRYVEDSRRYERC
ncbi:MAG: hypothetical protein MRERC_3c008 [Mycoplasmataceae bacterium RC_NB112A]|nr:MAG: hypothetical protein MRERC_9c080 [Mycoplasmataceae bacterium RC_NB112A]KLL02187.1 MAG: hypothetical protein MRERC_3c008 [Mycoplasmataceae bacterium RC_NB112A]